MKAYLFLRQPLGGKEISLIMPEGADIEQLLQVLQADYGLPEEIKLSGSLLSLTSRGKLTGLAVLLNGRNIKHLQGISTVLNDGAVISLFPPAAGG